MTLTLNTWSATLATAIFPTAAAASDTEPAERGEMLDFPLDAAIIQLILFVVVIFLLGKFIWPKILSGLQARENKIRADLERAEQSAAEASAKIDQYNARLAEARQEAQQIIDKSRSDALSVAAQVKEQAQAEISALKHRAERDIHAAKQQCIAEIHQQTAALATRVAGQILQREIRAEEHDRLVQESLRQFAKGRD